MTADPSDTEPDSYRRGVSDGQILSRLQDHDDHFKKINGSIDRLGNEMHQLVLSLQRFSDSADSRDSLAVETAKAVADAETKRRQAAERKWNTFQKLFAVIAALAATITIAGVLVTFLAR